VARDAILGSFILPVAVEARAHGVFNEKVGGCGLGHVAVACGTSDMGAGVRGVRELHQRFRREGVDAPPGDFAFGSGKRREFLDFGFGGGHLGVAEHAFVEGGEGGRRAGIGGAVTIQAEQTERKMLAMRVGDRLDRRRCYGLRDQDAD